jgi:group I intron endonuclease
MIGVYKITNTLDGKVYIGSTTVSADWRWSTHKALLKTGKHYNIHLQRAWSKYGEKAFTFEIVEQGTTKEDIRQKELSWIARFFGKNCYNATTQAAGRPANPNKKPKMSHEEVLAARFEVQKQKRERNRLIREQNRKPRIVTAETRRKIGEGNAKRAIERMLGIVKYKKEE